MVAPHSARELGRFEEYMTMNDEAGIPTFIIQPGFDSKDIHQYDITMKIA